MTQRLGFRFERLSARAEDFYRAATSSRFAYVRPVTLKSESWSVVDVGRAESFLSRFRGLRGRPAGTAVLMETTSVHGFGLTDPFYAVALTGDLVVSEVRRVDPGSVAWFRGCKLVLELPIGSDLPVPGERLELAHG